ncbi:MAG TPA: NADH-quinone oxidoreductase subunit H [Candidatus Cloacimonadota bacterium]|nr:NADH-quinone oxidoreductase subunit H [Candidatus Cloacimonadota bacterium]
MNWLSLIFPISAWLLAPLLLGVINRIKSVFAGRKGPSLFQLYYDIFKLLQKGRVYSRSTTLISRIAPILMLSCVILATLILPWGGMPAPVTFAGDFILLIYLLGLARFATVLLALDTGSAFEGMGASREVQFSALAEPALFLGFIVLILHTRSMSLSAISSNISIHDWQTSAALLVMVSFAWFFILLTENARIPVDDPNTHLELTMIHEVMILDASGPDLAFIEYASSLKLWLFSGLLVNLVVPLKFESLWQQFSVFIIGMLLVSILIGIIESVMARLKLLHIPIMLISSAALGLIALMIKILGFYQ